MIVKKIIGVKTTDMFFVPQFSPGVIQCYHQQLCSSYFYRKQKLYYVGYTVTDNRLLYIGYRSTKHSQI